MKWISKILILFFVMSCIGLFGLYTMEQSGKAFVMDRMVNDEPLVCTLTSSELLERKEVVLEKFKSSLIEAKEIKQGYAFKFDGADTILDDLISLIKAERKCCRFLTFDLSIQKEENPIWFRVTGPIGTKLFLKYELDLGT